MKTIRGKLLVYFLVFVILFQITAISIFVSSNQLTNAYDDSFQRFLLLNDISQKSEELYAQTKVYVMESKTLNQTDYFAVKKTLENEKDKLKHTFADPNKIEIKNYISLIETFINESELTVGFFIRGDIEQYTYHLEEARNASSYIQTSALEIIDVELTDYQSFYQDLKLRNDNFFIFIIFLSLTTIMLAVFFALWFSKGITQPIDKLSHAATEVAKGDLLGAPVEIRSNDELKLLGDTFNDMRSNIHGLVEEIKDQSELDRLIKEMELKHLQNQINPHFLFNTLNTMSKMAYLEDASSTSSLIDSVATLLRHSLGQIDKPVALRDEVEVVQDYFHIQKIRFSERSRFELDVDDNCLNIEIPRLTLQPLVENAFIHGIEEKETGGTITLTIRETARHIIVEVSDDGVGMPEEKVKQLLSMTPNTEDHVGHSTGIGLTNVIRRLQIHYKVEEVVQIESKLGKGTTVRLLLPKEE